MTAVATGSSSVLWATASKEWVIQPKPKPGRKPKRDPTVAANEDPELQDGRRNQNRAAQRAFRERKQSQLAELQSRLQMYEQGEIERNVALQTVAKRLKDETCRLKEENEALRRENTQLKDTVTILERERDTLVSHKFKKRPRDDSPHTTHTSSVPPTAKKTRAAELGDEAPGLMYSHSPSPSSMASSPESFALSDSSFSPCEVNPHGSGLSNVLDFGHEKEIYNSQEFPTFDCGFCDASSICVCRQVAMQTVTSHLDFKTESFDQPNVIRLDPAPQSSILDNLPAYQPAVPLRRRTGTAKKVFNVVVPLPETASCSGDPNNCLACANDSFGKAFCEAIGQSASVSPDRCLDCPGNCGNGCGTSTSDAVAGETMSTDSAWKQLKRHPNVDFSDLAMLADTVWAASSKCSGPQVDLNSFQSTNAGSESISPPIDVNSSTNAVHLIYPHEQYNERNLPPQLVPQEVLIKCGQQRRDIVQTAGVRDALRLLDAKFT